MSTALIGIAIIQWLWIKWAVDLNQTSFEDRVRISLNRVKDRLLDDSKTYNNLEDFNSGILKSTPEWLKKSREKELLSNLLITQAQPFFTPMQKDRLDKFVKQEISEQGIDIAYDYGVYDEESEEFTILNGYFTVPLGEIQASQSENSIEKNLYNSDYKISLFKPNESLIFYFPTKNSFIWASVIPQMISSIVFTGLILVCFMYTIYIIFKQKKISEITNDFINNMTHEFKTPIATISLASDSIASKSIISDEKKITKFLNIIKQENKRMLSQVEKVLQMAILEKKDFKLKLTDIHINDVVRQAVRNSELQVNSRNGSITAEYSAEPDTIQGDITHISNIINNLLDNANKYSPENPKIEVITSNTRGGVQVSIKDYGLGISKEAQKQIFDKFFRVHTGNLHDVKGFGLGLSYVKAMVDAHGGTIKVDSKLGDGSNFILIFPYQV